MSDEAYEEAIRLHCVIGPEFKCLGKYINATLNTATNSNRTAAEIALLLKDNFGMTYIPGKSFSLRGEKGILYNGIDLKSNHSNRPIPSPVIQAIAPPKAPHPRIPGVTPRREQRNADPKDHPSYIELSHHLGLN